MSRPAPRLVALDVDGTLLETGTAVQEATAQAAAAVREAGHHGVAEALHALLDADASRPATVHV